jgi:hypothetical protein
MANSSDASRVFLKQHSAAEGALIRAAASTRHYVASSLTHINPSRRIEFVFAIIDNEGRCRFPDSKD